jgi:hypothetical protein
MRDILFWGVNWKFSAPVTMHFSAVFLNRWTGRQERRKISNRILVDPSLH